MAAGIGRRAVEGQELALDPVAVACRRLRLGRHAEGGDDGERRLGAGVGQPDRQVAGREPQRGAGRGRVVHQHRAGRGVARQRVRGEERPEALLGRALGSGRRDDGGERPPVDGVAAGLDGERQHPRRVARAAAVVGAPELLRLARLRRDARAPEHRVGPRLVAGERQGEAELGLGERGREGSGAGVGVVAQVADRRPAFARQHHQRVGEILAAVLEVAIGVDEVREVAERRLEGAVGHRVALRARPGEEVGDIGVEPAVAARLGAPEAEAAGAGLVGEDVPDRRVEPRLDLVHAGDPEPLGGRREVEERHRPADDLLGAAPGVGLERGQEARHVEGRERADRHRRLGRPRREPVEHVGVEGERRAGGELDPVLARQHRVVRPDRHRQPLAQARAARRRRLRRSGCSRPAPRPRAAPRR